MLLFLDIDGVMVPAKGWKRPELLSDGFPDFSSRAVGMLQHLLAEDTIVMLTTSHKSRFSIDEWNGIFERRGLSVKHLKTLDDNTSCRNRKDEVVHWFNLNNVNEECIIIDDDKSLNDLPTFLKERLVLTSSLVGLTENHMDELEDLLGRKLQIA